MKFKLGSNVVRSVTANSGGRFSASVAPGRYNVEVSKGGYFSVKSPVTVPAGRGPRFEANFVTTCVACVCSFW